MLKRTLLLFLLPLLSFCQLTLVENGIPKSDIVIGEHPTRSAQFAAFELQHGVKLITGAVLPIVEKVEKAEKTEKIEKKPTKDPNPYIKEAKGDRVAFLQKMGTVKQQIAAAEKKGDTDTVSKLKAEYKKMYKAYKA